LSVNDVKQCPINEDDPKNSLKNSPHSISHFYYSKKRWKCPMGIRFS